MDQAQWALEVQALTLRIQQLETSLNNRDAAVVEVAQAAGQAAVQAAQNQPDQLDEHGQPINRRAEKRYDTAAKACAGIPKFHGNESWRNFESSYLTWYRINNIVDLPPAFQKRSLLMGMRGQAIEMTRPYAENTATWNNCPDLQSYVDAMRGVFLPPEESELARTEFKVRKQGRREDISTYLSSKIALWQLAYAENERSFSNLMDEIISGIANKIVKRTLRYATINDIEQLRRQAVRIVAAERQCYREGTAESTSLDGLAATTRIADQTQEDDDDMDHDGVNAIGKFPGNCRSCGKYGHRASDCFKNKPRGGSSRTKEGRQCFRCDRSGHLKADCHAKTKANGDKIVGNPSKGKETEKREFKKKKWTGKSSLRKQEEETDEEDENGDDDFLEEREDSEEEE